MTIIQGSCHIPHTCFFLVDITLKTNCILPCVKSFSNTFFNTGTVQPENNHFPYNISFQQKSSRKHSKKISFRLPFFCHFPFKNSTTYQTIKSHISTVKCFYSQTQTHNSGIIFDAAVTEYTSIHYTVHYTISIYEYNLFIKNIINFQEDVP